MKYKTTKYKNTERRSYFEKSKMNEKTTKCKTTSRKLRAGSNSNFYTKITKNIITALNTLSLISLF